MALHPEADCRDIVLAGFLSGFVDELGELLLALPQSDPALQMARAAYLWAEERPGEAEALLAAIPADAAERGSADWMRARIAATVTVLTFSGSPGGSATDDSALHRLRRAPGAGLRIVTAGLRDAEDLPLEDGQAIQPLLAERGIAPALVYDILEDAYLPPDFETLPCPRLAVLADMHHHLLRRNGYYQRHDLLLAQSSVQYEMARRTIGRPTVYMPNADAIFEDLAAAPESLDRSIDFSYGGALLRYMGKEKQRTLWPIVNSAIDRRILAYQGRFDGDTYERLQAQSRATASFGDFPDFVAQPRTFQYLRKGAALVMTDGRFHRLILEPLGVRVQSVREAVGQDAEMGSDPAAPYDRRHRRTRDADPLATAGHSIGRQQYRQLAASHFGRPPAGRPRPGRRGLRHTMALGLFQASRLQAVPQDTDRYSPGRAAGQVAWCPHFAGRDPRVDAVLAARFQILHRNCRSAAQYNEALLLNRRILQSLTVPHTLSGTAGATGDRAAEPADPDSQAACHDRWLAIASEGTERYPDSAVLLLWFLTGRFGLGLPDLPPDRHAESRDLVDRLRAGERLRHLNAVPQPMLDLGSANDDRLMGVCGMAEDYLSTWSAQDRQSADNQLSQSLRRAALAYLCLVSGELHRHREDAAAALADYAASLDWWYRHPSAYLPMVLSLRHWPMETVIRHLEPQRLLGLATDILNDAPETLRAIGPDLVALCHAIGDYGRATRFADLWFRWLYRVVGADGPLFGAHAVNRIRQYRHLWPLWVVNRLEGRPAATIRLAEAYVDYRPLDDALRHGIGP